MNISELIQKWDREGTPSIAEYLEAEKHDSNLWWRISCGHHQNLFGQAMDVIDGLHRPEEEDGDNDRP